MKGKPNYWQGKFVLNPNTLKISWAVWNVEIFYRDKKYVVMH